MSLTVIGDAFIDVIVPLQGDKPGETHHRKIITRCGGTATVAVQVSRLGGESKFVGKVGADVFGEYFRQNLRMNAVRDLLFTDNENATGICVSLSYPNGERTMIASRGANDFLQKEEVESCLGEIVNSTIVYFSGYSLLSEVTAGTVLYLMEKCRQQDCTICFNPGAPNLITENTIEVIHRFVDILILNLEEARRISGQDTIGEVSKSLGSTVDLAVITVGEGGCIVARGGKYLHVATEKVKGLDTTGAGDAFSAGFIFGKLGGLTDEKCAETGNLVALRWLKEAGEHIS